jgi:hypothetical protein
MEKREWQLAEVTYSLMSDWNHVFNGRWQTSTRLHCVTSQMTVIFIYYMLIITKNVKLYLENLMQHVIGAIMCRTGPLNCFYVIINAVFEDN